MGLDSCIADGLRISKSVAVFHSNASSPDADMMLCMQMTSRRACLRTL